MQLEQDPDVGNKLSQTGVAPQAWQLKEDISPEKKAEEHLKENKMKKGEAIHMKPIKRTQDGSSS